MSTDEKIRNVIGLYIERQVMLARHWLTYCESPIEQLFLAELISQGWSWLGQYEFTQGRDVAREAGITFIPRCSSLLLWNECVGWALVRASVEVAEHRYRVDFAFLFLDEGKQKTVVELDGHDFHERTKEQARRDKSRDRALTNAGWRVLRFTGSEVYESVSDCVAEVLP